MVLPLFSSPSLDRKWPRVTKYRHYTFAGGRPWIRSQSCYEGSRCCIDERSESDTEARGIGKRRS